MILRIIKILFYLALLIFLLAIPVNIWLKSDAAKNMISDIITSSIQDKTDYDIAIDGMQISLPTSLSCDRITLKRQDEILLDIEELSINVSLLPLMFREFYIQSIFAKKLAISKNISQAFDGNKQEQDGDRSSRVMFDITVNSLAIVEIVTIDEKLSSEVKTDELSMDLSAYIKLSSNTQKLKVISQVGIINSDNEYISGSTLSAVMNYNLNNQIAQIDNIELNSPAIKATGNLSVDNSADKISGNVKYESSILGNKLNEYLPGSSGELSGNIEIAGKPDHIILTTDGDISAKLAEIDFYKFPDMKWQSLINISDGRVWGSLNMQQANFNATGNFSYRDDIFSLNDFIAKSQISEKKVSIIYNVQKDRIDADIAFKSKNIKDLQAYMPVAYQGEVNTSGKYIIEQKGKKIAVDMQADIKNIESEYFKVSNLSAKLKSQNIMDNRLGEGKLSFERFIRNNLFIKKGNIEAKESSNGININTKIEGQIKGSDMHSDYPIIIAASKNLNIKPDNINLNISNVEGTLGAAKISMQQLSNLQLFLKDNSLLRGKIDIPQLIIDQGKLSIVGNVSAKKIDLQSSFNGIGRNIFHDLLTDEFNKAIFAGEIKLVGDVSSPQLDSSINVKNIIIDSKKTLADLIIDSQMNNNKLLAVMNLNIKSKDNIKHVANVNTVFPVSFQLYPFIFELHKDRPFELDYSTKDKFNIGGLVKLPVGHKLRGVLEGMISARGTIDRPIIKGEIDLTEGKYSYKHIGLKTKDITAKISAKGNKILFQNIRIGDFFGKFIDGNGQVTISDNLPYNFVFETQEFNLLSNPYIQGLVSGKVDIKGIGDKVKSSGDVIIGPMEIKIPERFGTSFPSLNVVEVIEEADQDTESEYTKSIDLELDIKAKTNDKVFVRGLGVNTRLEGDLHITGTAEKPNIRGILKSVKGKFNEFGRQLEITKGELVFDGPVPPSPYLYIVGTYQGEKHEISLILRGTISEKLDISIASIPETPQEEALSILLFDSKPEEVSAFQAVQLANGMRKFSGKGGGVDPLDISKKLTGLDEVNIKQDSRDSANTSIGLGKHISDKFYIEVEQGFQGETKTKIEVELSPKFTLEGSVDSTDSGKGNVGINWKMDY